MDNVLELKLYDVYITETDSGQEVIRLDSRIAFSQGLIDSLKEKGVKKIIFQEKTEEKTVDMPDS